MSKRRLEILAVAASLCLLAGAAVESASIRPPADASAYHARCRAAAAGVPVTIGDWAGKNVEVAADAVTLLRPNVALSREFTHAVSGQQASLFIVQCLDARDITSHYPPICYPVSRGMEQVSARPRDWQIGDLNVAGTEYEFRSSRFGPGSSVVVQNFILLPHGRIARDMTPVKEQLPLRNRYYGAAQVQLVFPSAVPAETRDAALVELIGGHRPLIDAVLRQGIGSGAVGGRTEDHE